MIVVGVCRVKFAEIVSVELFVTVTVVAELNGKVAPPASASAV